MADRQVETKFMNIQQPTQIVDKYNAITLINTGGTAATVNNFPLAAGASVGWAHNANEINTGQIWVDFPSGGTGFVWAILIVYKTPA